MGRDFKIIIPGGCNARCSFCFAGETKKTSPTWIGKLVTALSDATPDFKELNITGGEPTASPFLIGALGIIKKYKHKFPKVVMTTNGYKLAPEILAGVVDHLNISRHSSNDAINNTIFGTNTVPYTHMLQSLISRCNEVGIDVSLSATLTQGLNCHDDIINMVRYTKDVGASALKLRRDYNLGLGESDLERQFSYIKQISESTCPVCRVKTQLISGLRVSWHAGVMEPSDIINDDVYEIILQPDGRVTLDYAGNKPYTFSVERPIHTSLGARAAAELRRSRESMARCGAIGCDSLGYGCGSFAGNVPRLQPENGCGSSRSTYVYSGCGVYTPTGC